MTPMSVLRANSSLRTYLGPAGTDFLEWSIGAFERILPHAEINPWVEVPWSPTASVWTSRQRTEIRITIAIGQRGQFNTRSLQTRVRRRNVPIAAARRRRVLDVREHDICLRVATWISSVLTQPFGATNTSTLRSLRDDFDEQIITDHLRDHHGLSLDLADTFDAIHELAEQTYENRPVTLGAILDPHKAPVGGTPVFPRGLLESKKYKALSDGFRTAYHVATDGHLAGFVELAHFDERTLSERHYYPSWSAEMASASRDGRCGICLTRQGDILVFDQGTLRFSYRYGQWQYWNHNHLIDLLKNRARAPKVSPSTIGKVVAAVYRAALDVSFRRSGGLFVVLHNRHDLSKIVRPGDELGSAERKGADRQFDGLLDGRTIQSLPREVVVELASLDGAVVVNNSGSVRAFGAVLRPKKKGRLKGTEGSRTQAAIGSSNYGLAVKISSDGAITVYHGGLEFLVV